jgi:hypothetical protein
MSQLPTHDTEASTFHVEPPAPDAAASQLELGPRRPGVPQTFLDEAQAEQELWQEFRAHDTSLNAALIEALWPQGAHRTGSSRWQFSLDLELISCVFLVRIYLVLILLSALWSLPTGDVGPGT